MAHGVHSEVGELRKVLVCSPGPAHRRLPTANAADLPPLPNTLYTQDTTCRAVGTA